ncbi:MAG: SDR family NAD(P)-dependent oxidoreductase [Cyclobacteriaceae bacterium]
MAIKKSGLARYRKQYEWSNILAMLKNNRRDPKICEEGSQGKLIVITGATSGIGLVTAKKYAAQGANLICINRNKEKSETLKQTIESTYNTSCQFLLADLSILKDVHDVANQLARHPEPIDVMIHNAGVYLNKREVTVDGLEKVFMVHYLAPFIINCHLIEKMKSQESGRIILVNSEGHRFAAWGIHTNDLNWEKRRYSGLGSYGSAKTAQLQSMLIFNQLLDKTGVTINAMHPGAVKSATGQENGPLYRWFKNNVLERHLKPATISSESLYYLGISSEITEISGKFFNLTELEDPAPPAMDIEIAEELWQISLEMGGVKDPRSESNSNKS